MKTSLSKLSVILSALSLISGMVAATGTCPDPIWPNCHNSLIGNDCPISRNCNKDISLVGGGCTLTGTTPTGPCSTADALRSCPTAECPDGPLPVCTWSTTGTQNVTGPCPYIERFPCGVQPIDTNTVN